MGSAEPFFYVRTSRRRGWLQVFQQYLLRMPVIFFARLHQRCPLFVVGVFLVYLEVLGAVRVQAFEQQGHVQPADVDRRLVGDGLALRVGGHLVHQLHFLQLLEEASGEADGYLAFLRNLFSRIRCLAAVEALGYERHHQHGHEVVVAAADVARVLVEAEAVDVLPRIGQLGAEEADGPRYLQPEQQQGEGGKTTVDGVVARHPQLAADVEELEGLIGGTCQDARDEGVPEVHLGVGHEDVEAREHAPREHEGDEPYQELAQRGEQGKVVHVLQHGAHEDGKTAREYQQDGDEQQHGEVVGDAPVDAPRLLHLPDAVEGHLHVVDQVEHRPEQHDEAHADEDAVLRLRQVGVDDVQDGAARLVQAAEAGQNFMLDHIVEAEPAGDGKNHGQDGDEGKQGAVGQGGGLVGQTVLGEAVDAEVDSLDDGVDGEGGFVHLVFGDAPDVIGEEFPKSCDSLVHGGGRSIHYIYKEKQLACKPGSVPRPQADQVPVIYLRRMSP